jgi:glutathione S-transferase-like protein
MRTPARLLASGSLLCGLIGFISAQAASPQAQGIWASTRKAPDLRENVHVDDIERLPDLVSDVPTLIFDDGNVALGGACRHDLSGRYKARSEADPAGRELRTGEGLATPDIHRVRNLQKFIPVFREYVTEYAKNKFRDMLISNFGSLDDRLADGRSYLTGETFTVADAHLFAVTPWVERTQVNIGHLKNLRAFQDRVAARPAAQAALRDEAAAAAS